MQARQMSALNPMTGNQMWPKCPILHANQTSAPKSKSSLLTESRPVVPHSVYGPTPTYGGNMAVIDNAGLLWTGSGAIDQSLLWLNTNNVAQYGTVPITHSANVLALDMAGDVWAAGDDSVTKIVAANKTVDANFPVVLADPSIQGSCVGAVDDCCV
jgi:hypothetical protein